MICNLPSERDELSPFFNFLIFNYISLSFHLFSFIYRIFIILWGQQLVYSYYLVYRAGMVAYASWCYHKTVWTYVHEHDK
jgi:hypothetical protein